MKKNNIKSAAKPIPPTAAKENKLNLQLAFGPINYILMVVGIVILAIGYILLSGGGSDDPNTFNPAMFDNRRLVLAPLLIIVGFVVEILAIMYKSKKQ